MTVQSKYSNKILILTAYNDYSYRLLTITATIALSKYTTSKYTDTVNTESELILSNYTDKCANY